MVPAEDLKVHIGSKQHVVVWIYIEGMFFNQVVDRFKESSDIFWIDLRTQNANVV